MCQRCWANHGRPGSLELPLDFPRFLELFQLIYDENAAGGPVHTVIDDWNIEDEHLKVWPGYDQSADEREASAWGEELIALMRGWTLRQRAAALARAHRYF